MCMKIYVMYEKILHQILFHLSVMPRSVEIAISDNYRNVHER